MNDARGKFAWCNAQTSSSQSELTAHRGSFSNTALVNGTGEGKVLRLGGGKIKPYKLVRGKIYEAARAHEHPNQ